MGHGRAGVIAASFFKVESQEDCPCWMEHEAKDAEVLEEAQWYLLLYTHYEPHEKTKE